MLGVSVAKFAYLGTKTWRKVLWTNAFAFKHAACITVQPSSSQATIPIAPLAAAPATIIAIFFSHGFSAASVNDFSSLNLPINSRGELTIEACSFLSVVSLYEIVNVELIATNAGSITGDTPMNTGTCTQGCAYWLLLLPQRYDQGRLI